MSILIGVKLASLENLGTKDHIRVFRFQAEGTPPGVVAHVQITASKALYDHLSLATTKPDQVSQTTGEVNYVSGYATARGAVAWVEVGGVQYRFNAQFHASLLELLSAVA